MRPSEFHRAKRRLIKKLTKIILDSEQIIDDIESWNAANPQYMPMDVGGQRVLHKMASDILARVRRNELIPESEYRAMLKQSEALANGD